MNVKYLKVQIMRILVFIDREAFHACLSAVLACHLHPSHSLNGVGQRKWVGLQSSDRLLQIMWPPAKTAPVGGKSGS